jgi:hypothetical protein
MPHRVSPAERIRTPQLATAGYIALVVVNRSADHSSRLDVTLSERDDHSPILYQAAHDLAEFLNRFVIGVIFEGASVFIDFVDVDHVRFPFDLPYVQPQRAGLTILGHSGVPLQQLQELV